MPPSRKTEMALMGMMEKFFENHSQCDCPDCRSSTKRLRKLTSQVSSKDLRKENISPSQSNSASYSGHLCPDHRPPPSPKKHPSKEKDKEKDKEKEKATAAAAASTSVPQQNRNDKVNKLLKADSIGTVLDVFKSTPTTADENKLAQDIQDNTAQCKTFIESKANIISFCHDDSVDLDAVFGLLAKFRQERSILTSAIIKSNTERDKTLAAIHEVDDLLGMLRDVSKDSKGPAEDDVRHSLSNMIFKVHDLAKNPSSLFEEFMDLKDEHLDLLADHEDQAQKFMDIESCHEKLHEDKKRLQDDLAWERREHADTRRRLGALNGKDNEVNQAQKSLQKVQDENRDLQKELEKLATELSKINAIKHENVQLRKKLADAVKVEPKIEEKSVEAKPVEATSTGKKRKGKKGGAAPSPGENLVDATLHSDSKIDLAREKELKTLQAANAEIQSQLGTAQTNLRQLEALLKKAEVARTKALERQQIEQATSQNWKEMSEGHAEESSRLREQLEESITHATSLQNDVHRLEQILAETKEQLEKVQSEKRSSTPSIQSQTSTTSRLDTESLRMLRKLRGETAQLVHDLDTAKSYPGDPWNLVECTRNMIAVIDQDLESMILPQRDYDIANPIPDTYLTYPRNELGIPASMSLTRGRDSTPPLSAARSRPLPSHRPLLPPGLADNLGRASPTPQHLPSPIGTGRPGKSPNGLTPSPTQAPARTVSFATPSTGSIGNGAAGVDWSIWAKR